MATEHRLQQIETQGCQTYATKLQLKGSEAVGDVTSYWILVSVLILLVVLDLWGLQMVGPLDINSSSERKPTSSVSVEDKKKQEKIHFNKCTKIYCMLVCQHHVSNQKHSVYKPKITNYLLRG